MFKVIIQELTGATERTIWTFDTIEAASEYIHNLHHNYRTFLNLKQGQDYEVELVQVVS